MKRLLTFFSVVVLFLACSKDTDSPAPAPQPKPKFTITVAAGEGGAVSSTGGSYEQGSTVSVTATAASGYRFVGWSNGETSATLNIVVTGNISVTANFERIAYSVDVSGAISKGAFLTGSTLTFYELNNSLSQTGKSYNTDITDDFGSFSLSVEELTQDYARVVGEGFYWNEVNNQTTEEKLSLNAISEIKESINVNILTHLEYQRVVELVKNQGRSFLDAKKQALIEVLSSLGIETATDYGTSEEYNFIDGDEASRILLVASVIIQAERTTAEVTSLITKVANDIKDNGNVDDTEVKTEIAVQLAKIDLQEVASNVYERYKGQNPELSESNYTSDYLETAKAEFQEFLPDADGDGVQDDLDLCPDTPEGEEADVNGCGKTQKQYLLTTTVEGSGSISEEVIQQPTASYDYGTTVRLTANPINGWEFKEWKGGITSTENPVDITVVEEVGVTAVFVRKRFTISSTVEGEGAISISPEGESYEFESVVELTASPEDGWAFSKWSGDISSTENPVSVNMDGNKEITAIFKLKQYELSISITGEGAVTEEIVTQPSQYENGTVVKLTANPSEGWAFTGWSGDLEGEENPTTITIDKAKSVTATFEKADSDGDGIPDLEDLCSDTPEGSSVNANGCHDFIYVSDNGITIKARETAIIGDTQELDGVEYTVVDETRLREMVANDEDVSKVVTSRVESMYYLFDGKTTFNKDISSWDVSSVTNMESMFRDATIFNQDIGAWDVSNVTTFTFTFLNTQNFNSDISSWDTSSAIRFDGMFANSLVFNQPIGGWDTSMAINMNGMFQNTPFNQDISNWNTSNVTQMGNMFHASEFNKNIQSWDVSNVIDMSTMFWGAETFNQPLGDWDVSNVTNMFGMFDKAYAFNQDLSEWDVSNVTNMQFMFVGTTLFNSNLSNWNVRNVVNMIGMFTGSGISQDLSGWCVTNIPNPPDGFSDGSKLNEDQLPVWGACPAEEDSDGDGVFDINDECADTPEGTPVDEKGCPEAAIYLGENGVTIKAKDFAVVGETYELDGVNYLIVDETLLREMVADDEDVSKVVTTKVTDMSSLFKEKESFNTNINNWDTSNVTDMKELFHRATSFNQELDHWDVSKVTNMRDMLSYTSFNKAIGQWEVSSVTDMENMFSFSPFNQSIGNWNVSNVVMMTGTFADTPFNQDISEWDVSSVQYFRYMFGTNPKFNQDISEWDVSGGVDFRNMFDGAASFNQNLSKWCTISANSFDDGGFEGSFSQVLSEYQIPVWGQCGEIYLDDNGVTIKARENAVVGESYKLTNEGDSYKVVDDTMLREMVANDEDVSKVVTTFCEGMSTLFQGKIEFNQDISSWDLSNVKGVGYMFNDAVSFNQDISYWNLENIVHLDGMFNGAKSFNQDITGWSFPKVTSFVNFLYGAESFNQDISKWDVSNITNMSHALAIMRDFNIDLSNWDVSNVTNMERMFHQNDRFNQDISNWDVSNVTNMHNMFGGATDFNQDLSTWCVSKIERYTDFNEGSALSIENFPIWGQCGEIELAANGITIVANENAVIGESYKLTNDGDSYKVVDETMLREMVANDEDVTKVVTSLCDSLDYLFKDKTEFNQDISSWDMSNVSSAAYFFENAESFNQDISTWRLTNLVHLDGMFKNARAFNQDISSWKLRKVSSFHLLFVGAESFNGNISRWDVSNITDMSSMFGGAHSFNQDISSWDVSNVTNMKGMFFGVQSFNQNISGWDVSRVTNMKEMFFSSDSFNQDLSSWCVSNIEEYSGFNEGSYLPDDKLPIWGQCGEIELAVNGVTIVANENAVTGESYKLTNDGDSYKVVDEAMLREMVANDEDVTKVVTTRVTDINYLFYLKYDFNQDIGSWDTSNITNMAAALQAGSAFNQDISNWDTSEVQNMFALFAGLSKFNIDISGWDVSNVVNMEQMFAGCEDFNQDISSWETSKVMNMRYMFYGASSFNQNINTWEVSNVTNMEGVFYDATSYNQPMNSWTTSNVTTMQNMFLGASNFNQKLSDWNTSKVLNMSGMLGGTNFTYPINDWDVSKVTNMRGMFGYTPFNQPLNNWDTSKVLDMDYMFQNSSFSQDISMWCVTLIDEAPVDFGNTNGSLPVWGSCPENDHHSGGGSAGGGAGSTGN